jgi:hypothetical protein
MNNFWWEFSWSGGGNQCRSMILGNLIQLMRMICLKCIQY